MGEIKADVDLVIVGGGVAGLWTLSEARARGYSAVVLQRGPLGEGQTAHSHVYLHRGHLYRAKDEAGVVRDLIVASRLWDRWLDQNQPALEDVAEPHEEGLFGFHTEEDATEVADLWTEMGLDSHAVSPPVIFEGSFHTSFLEASARCLNASWMIGALAAPHEGSMLQIVSDVTIERAFGAVTGVTAGVPGDTAELMCEGLVLCAGAGNAELVKKLPLTSAINIRQRPSWMLVVVGASSVLPPLSGMFPLEHPQSLFIVARRLRSSDEVVWLVSDTCLQNATAEWVRCVIEELNLALPKAMAERDQLRWAVYEAPKAEVKPEGVTFMGQPFITQTMPNAWAVWPMKLTLAPLAAKRALDQVDAVLHGSRHSQPSLTLPRPEIAAETWEAVTLQTWDAFAGTWGLSP